MNGTAIADDLDVIETATAELQGLERPDRPLGQMRHALGIARRLYFENVELRNDHVPGPADVEVCADVDCDLPRMPPTGKPGRPPTHCEWHIDRREPVEDYPGVSGY